MATVTVTPGYSWSSGEIVTPAKMNLAAAPVVTAVVADGEVTDAKLAASLNLSSKTLTLPNTSVTLAQLVTAVQQSLVPAGAVQPFAMNSAPTGWLAANGTAVSRSTYAALFGAIGTTYGAGNGSTTFNVPDLRGIFVRGSGSQAIAGITYNKSFATKERDAFQGHHHAASVSHNAIAASGTGQRGTGAPSGAASISVSVEGATEGNNGAPRIASETRPANIALLYCIKF
jgi:microcystin-dependent protein